MNKLNINALDTEEINVNTIEIDSMSTLQIATLFNEEDKKVAVAVEKQLQQIAKIITIAEKTLKQDGRIIYLGAGNSGRIAAGDACECIPTFGVEENVVVYVLAGGSNALLTANEGAEDDYHQGAIDLKNIHLNMKDFVIGLSASGRTPYVKGGLDFANSLECKTASISCSRNSIISKNTDVSVEILVGPEAITGSTRLKAGTAQKMVVNMISSGVMIKLGKVYKNYMIDLSVKNEKLFERGKKIIKEVTGVNDDIAKKYLEKSKGKVKIAVLMILKEISFDESVVLLKDEQNIRKLLKY